MSENFFIYLIHNYVFFAVRGPDKSHDLSEQAREIHTFAGLGLHNMDVNQCLLNIFNAGID